MWSINVHLTILDPIVVDIVIVEVVVYVLVVVFIIVAKVGCIIPPFLLKIFSVSVLLGAL